MLLLLYAIVQGQQLDTDAAKHLDDELILRVARGDTEALADLYAQTKSAVYGFALSILRHPSSAEDVMQDTYIRVFQAAGSYRPQGKPMAWILTIVRNLSLMKLRSQRGGSALLEEIDPPDPSQAFEGSSLDRLLLHAALNRLTAEERQIIVLHSVSGLKHREIAALLESPLSTVLSRYNRGLKKLKKIIEEGESTC